MELQQLRYFKALAEHGNLAKAAESLYISPPALSASISRLERELSVRLFDRTNRGLRLNRRGIIYLGYVEQLLLLLENANREISDSEQYEADSLAIAVTSPHIWQSLIGEFMLSYPGVTLSHTYVKPNQITSNDLLDRYDYIIAATGDIKKGDILYDVVYDNDPSALLVYPSHPFAQYESIELHEAKDEPFICLSKGLSGRKIFDELFAMTNITPQVRLECDYSLRRSMILSGHGIGITTVRAAQLDAYSPLKYIPISSPVYMRSQSLYHHVKRLETKTTLAFKKFALEFFKKY